jgi:tRNA (guanine37-N1)-methyltransferase
VKISVLTIFPDFFPAVISEGMIRAAREKGRLEVAIVSLRDFTDDRHRTTDDYPFGGGAGMIMKVEPIDRALQSLGVGEKGARPRGATVVLLSPQGRAFTQKAAIEFSGLEHLVLVCGRYKGVDERVSLHLADEELSVGDFVLSGGEPAALCVVDAIARLLPGVVSTFDSVESDSFHSGLLDAPYYTRPATYRGWSVPDLLLSGHHANIARARREESLSRTAQRRPDLLANAPLTAEDRRTLARLGPQPAVEAAPPPPARTRAPARPKPPARAKASAHPKPPARPKPSARPKAAARRKPSAPRKTSARRGV